MSGLQKKQTQANVDKATQVGNEVYDREIASGKSDKAAKFAAAQVIAKSSGGAVSLNEIAADGSLPSHGSINSLDESTGFYLSNKSDRGFISYSASMSDVSQFLAGSPAYDLGMRHASQMFGIKASGDMAFAQGVARGEAMYAAGVRNREQIGVDFTQFNRQVDRYVQFRDAQRAAFQADYNSYNGFQKFASNTGANLFGGLISGGQAIGDATALLGIQGSDAFSHGWSNVGDTLSYVASNPVDALVVNPATAAYNRYSSIYNSDGLGAAAGTFTGDILSGSVFTILGGGFGAGVTRLDVNLNLNGTSVHRFSGNNGSYGGDHEFATQLPTTRGGALTIYHSPLGVNGFMPTKATVYHNPLFNFSDKEFVNRNLKIRNDYIAGTQELIGTIDLMKSAGYSSESIARRAVIQRNSQKMEARAFMTQPEVNLLDSRNMGAFYKHPIGPTPDQMFKKYGDWDTVMQKTLSKDNVINLLLGVSPRKF